MTKNVKYLPTTPRRAVLLVTTFFLHFSHPMINVQNIILLSITLKKRRRAKEKKTLSRSTSLV